MKVLLTILAAGFFCSNALGEQCSVNFNYGIIIDPNHIRILHNDKTYVQINNNNQLFVNGNEITLNDEQLLKISHYSMGIRKQIPEMVSIAIEGVDIGLKAVNKVIGGLTGENSESHQKIQERFEEIKWRIRKRFNHSDNNYYLAPQDLDNFDELFTGEFEQEIEEIVSESIGTILMVVGGAMLNSENENSELQGEKRVVNFDDRIESMTNGLKLEIGSNARTLENKAEIFCLSLVALNEIEDDLQISIEQLHDYNLIEAKK